MSDAKLMIKLTAEQQKQVFEATGKTCTALTFDVQAGKLTERELGAVAGGSQTVDVPGETTVGGQKAYKAF